jgi:putative tryptophan/tyrosine transport system permease protein
MLDIFLIILEQALLHIPLVVGAYISISLMKVPDLALESAYVFGAILGSQAVMLGNNFSSYFVLASALIASLFGGALVGFTSSFITQKGGVPHLLSSIVTIGLFNGINHLISNSYQSLAGYPNPLTIVPGIRHHPEFFVVAIIAIMVVCSMALLLKTELGYSFVVYGNNPNFFKHYGISTTFVGMVGIMLSNALAGCSGYLFAQSNGFVEVNMGFGKILLCITSLLLGKLFLKTSSQSSIYIPVVGTLSYFSLQQFLLKVGFNLKYFTAVQAFVVLLLLLVLFRSGGSRKKIDHLGV